MILIRIVSIIALFSYLALFLLVSRQARRNEVRSFGLFLLAMLIWQLGVTAASFTSDPQMALFCYRMVVGLGQSFGLFYAQFSRDFLGIRSRRWIIRIGYVWAAIMAAWALSGRSGLVSDIYISPQSGLLLPNLGLGAFVSAVVTYGYLVYSVVLLVRYHQHTTSIQMRIRIKYLVIGLILVFLGSSVNLTDTLRPYPLDMVANAINAGLIAYAILRYQLLDIVPVLRKGLIYSVLTAVTALTYYAGVFLALNFFHIVAGYQFVLFSLVLAAVTAVAMQPLRDAMQLWVDRLFFREKYDSNLMLQRLSQVAVSVLDLERLTDMILEDVTRTMHIRSGAFLIKEEAAGEYCLKAQRGLPSVSEHALSFKKDHPIVVWLAGHRDALSSHTLELDPNFIGLWASERQELGLVDAQLFVPLLARDKLIGVLILGSKLAETPYSPDEQSMLNMLANHMAVAVENARLFSIEQQKLKTSSALLAVARAMSSTLDLDRMLRLIAQRTVDVCGFDRCSIFVVNERDDDMRLLVSRLATGMRRAETEKSRGWASPDGKVQTSPLLMRLVRERRPMIIGKDSASDLPADWAEQLGVKGLLTVPLISKDRASGLLTLEHFQADSWVTSDQVDLAATIASQVSVAIEDARLYRETLAEKERTATIVEQAFAGIVMLDAQLNVVSLNPAAEAIIGEGAAQIIGQPLREVFGPSIASEGSSLQKAMTTGERVAPTEQKLIRGDRRRDVLLGVTPLREGYLLSLADITELKEVDRLKSDIIANVSHEFRTPLAIIKAYAELLMDDEQSAILETRHEFLSIIDAETDRLAGMVGDLLDLARLEAGQGAMPVAPLAFSEVVDEAMSLLRFQASSRNISIEIDVPPYLPPLMGSKDVLTTLLRNLLGNAIKFSREGGCVRLIARRNGGSLVLQIVDQGIGIAEEDIPHLFEKFYRAKAAQEAGIRGTGLGLVLAKQAVEMHKGTIAVESRRGVGTCFTIILPVLVNDERITSQAAPEPIQGFEELTRQAASEPR